MENLKPAAVRILTFLLKGSGMPVITRIRVRARARARATRARGKVRVRVRVRWRG